MNRLSESFVLCIMLTHSTHESGEPSAPQHSVRARCSGEPSAPSTAHFI